MFGIAFRLLILSLIHWRTIASQIQEFRTGELNYAYSPLQDFFYQGKSTSSPFQTMHYSILIQNTVTDYNDFLWWINSYILLINIFILNAFPICMFLKPSSLAWKKRDIKKERWIIKHIRDEISEMPNSIGLKREQSELAGT